MKQNDIALVLVIGFVGGVIAIVLSTLVFSPSSKKQLTSSVVTAIKPDFKQPDKKYFNSESIDPTQIIRIGQGANDKPFNQ